MEVEVCHPRAIAQRKSYDQMKTYLPHIFLRKGYDHPLLLMDDENAETSRKSTTMINVDES